MCTELQSCWNLAFNAAVVVCWIVVTSVMFHREEKRENVNDKAQSYGFNAQSVSPSKPWSIFEKYKIIYKNNKKNQKEKMEFKKCVEGLLLWFKKRFILFNSLSGEYKAHFNSSVSRIGIIVFSFFLLWLFNSTYWMLARILYYLVVTWLAFLLTRTRTRTWPGWAGMWCVLIICLSSLLSPCLSQWLSLSI